jgi:hypothetical protein
MAQVAAVAYSQQVRQAQQTRQRQRVDNAAQRQQQQGGSSAAAAAAAGGGDAAAVGSSKAAAVLVLLPQVSFMTCLSRWLAHSSSKELLRAKLDELLLRFPGVEAQTLPCYHSCVSAIQLSPSPLAAAAAAAPSQQQQQQRGAGHASDPDPDLKSGSNVLVLLNDTSISLEGPGLGRLAGARGWLGQASRPRDVQQPVMYLHALPGLLAPALQQMR